MRNNPINKDKVSTELVDSKKFGKSIIKETEKGHIVKRSDLTMKKPGNGISYENEKCKKKIKKDVSINIY